MQTGLKSKNVIVTGASGGIGGEIARSFAAEGANVTLHYFQNHQRAEQISQNLAEEFPHISVACIGADLTKEDDVASLFASSEKQIGAADCLIANAGSWPSDHQTIDEIPLDRWQRTISANLTSTYLCMKHFFASIRRCNTDSPSAVMIGSTAGIFGEAGHSDYSAAKAAIVGGMLPSLKNEMVQIASLGRVNVVSPGWTMTPMTRKFANNPEAMTRALQTIPLRKFGKPEDVAATAVFLCSQAASHITGQVITTGGGMEGRVLFSPDQIDSSNF